VQPAVDTILKVIDKSRIWTPNKLWNLIP
jgi:hypothetical protein